MAGIDYQVRCEQQLRLAAAQLGRAADAVKLSGAKDGGLRARIQHTQGRISWHLGALARLRVSESPIAAKPPRRRRGHRP